MANPLKYLCFIFLLSVIIAAAPDSKMEAKPAADLIIRNAKVWTGDSNHPAAEAVAVIGDRIVAVGSAREIDLWRGPRTRVIDARGKLLLPGFNDAHVHFVEGGAQLDSIQLNDATSAAEFARRVAERAHSTPKGEWILNGDWDETKWTPPQLPTRELIDPATPDNPVFLDRYDGHMALANSVALRMAGITAQTPDPPGGIIVRDEDGNPTGALKDAAKDFVLKVIPALSHEQRMRQARRALAYAVSLGLTSVQEMNDAETDSFADFEVYSELLE
ncbi:MAG: amidohydrolase, partial [Terriglobales bacterium]